MKNIKRLIYYISDYKGSIVLYFVCSLLAVVFSVFSMGSLMPVLQVLFSGDEKPKPKANPNIIEQLHTYIFDLTEKNGPINALALICVAIVLFVALKNIFTSLPQFV